MKKGFLSALTMLFLMCIFSFQALGDMSTELVPNSVGWVLEGEEWRYRLSEHEYLEKDWISEKGKWYYLDEDGYMVVGSRKISGKYYYFRENGEMAIGWAYDDEESQWYYMNDNGTRKTGWYQAGGVWYWFDSKGILYQGGSRMIDAHKYHFFDNGQMAGNTYVETGYYGSDGLRNRQYDMIIQGKRKPTEEEKTAITKAMEKIPGEWIDRSLKDGWEVMFYTDRDYFSAPSTDQGVYYINYKTDTNYKKIKFTKPEALVMAFGEYIAYETGHDKEDAVFMADFQQYLAHSSLQPLPSYFDDKPEAWFGLLLEGWGDADIFYDIKKKDPELADFITKVLRVDTTERRPGLDELRDRLYEASEGTINARGPSTDDELGKKYGPAYDTAEKR